MKKIISIIVLIASAVLSLNAQVPYFAGTVGNNRLYGYTSIKARPGVSDLETYTTFQYGIGKYLATGLDLYTSGKAAYSGLLVRVGFPVSKYFNIGLQATPSFDLSNSFNFEYFTGALYLNGAITTNGHFFYTANTWLGINKHSANTINQWLYLGYTLPLPKGLSVTPMLGTLYSWKFDNDADLSVGAYLSIKNYNIYLWTNDICKSHPRIVLGADFVY